MAGEREPVARALDILAWMAAHPAGPWSVRQAARDIGTSPTTIHRTFRIFEERGLIGQGEDRTYTPGLELFRMCRALASELSPVKIARPHMEELVKQSGETVLLGGYDWHRRQMMFLDIAYAPHPLRYVLDLQRWIPVHAGASGLAILASLPAGERRRVYAAGLETLTEATLVDGERLEEASREIRERGYAKSRGQRMVGAVALAAPIFDSGGDVFGDVCITIPDQRYEDRLEGVLAPLVVQVGASISAELKHVGFRHG
jgi:IclR family transcriptional regulator, acetate operon repressor